MFESGMVIEDGYYGDNDFVDVEKSRVIIEIVGGLCDKRLGESTVHMKIVGCDWNKVTTHQPVDLETYTQSVPRQIYSSVPAHLLDIHIRKIHGRDHISEFFQQIVRTIDLRDTNAADVAIEKAEESESPTNTSKGITEEEELKGDTRDSLETTKKDEEEGMELVRFQYDGKLMLEFETTGDELACTPEYEGADSLHVLPYMTGFRVTIKPKYEIITDE
eukprot:5764265-Ditylum_brightwellii.AAC.1